MMGRIQQLPPEVANQIAAGEVIERPASIVKELLENALDAGSRSIHIDINYGGLNQITVSDNGVGILAEDLPLAVAAHATSKITQLKDLYAIQSMGFRGEALASIASIARLTISSKPAAQENAMMLKGQAGAFQLLPCARKQGTTMDVRDIFYNAPVRKKFLKSERIEYQAIERVVRQFALSASMIALELSHNGKLQLQLPAASEETARFERMTKVLGSAFVKQSLYIEAEHAGMRLEGWISDKNYQRSQNDRLWIYINGRMVRDKLINHAIKQAYENCLHPGKHPACLLYFTLAPSLVDVNVHPTKHEVRFQEPRLVHDFIRSQLNRVLDGFAALVMTPLPKIQLRDAYRPEKMPLYSASPQVIAPSISHRNESWISLNTHFAVIFIHSLPYLVDLDRLQSQFLLDRLQKAALPFASRALLVPITVPGPSIPSEQIGVAQELLRQVGFELTQAKDFQLVVNTIPLLVPHINIPVLFKRFFAKAITTLSDLLTLLASQPSYVIKEAERADYLDWLQMMLSQDPECDFAKPLSEKSCRDFLNV